MLAAVPLGLAALGLGYLGGPAFYAIVGLVAVGMAYEWLRLCFGQTPSGRKGVGPAMIGLGFIVLVALATSWLRGGLSDGRALILWLLLVVWATDSGAYFVGRTLKGPRLWPKLSPKKTWSGAIGGLLLAMMVSIGVGHGVAVAGWTGSPSVVCLVFAGLMAGVLTQAGDLLESAAKRHHGVKDTGALIPGHGGLLDRLDGFSTAALGLALAVLGGGGEALMWAAH